MRRLKGIGPECRVRIGEVRRESGRCPKVDGLFGLQACPPHPFRTEFFPRKVVVVRPVLYRDIPTLDQASGGDRPGMCDAYELQRRFAHQ